MWYITFKKRREVDRYFTQACENGGLNKKDNNYFHHQCNNFTVPLYKTPLSSFSFYICDENSQQINFSRGNSSFLHCELSESGNMNSRLAYFNPGDSESLKLFPSNKV